MERNNWEGRYRMEEERLVSEWGGKGKMELYIRVTALLCKSSQQGERKREGKVCVWEAGMKKEGGLSEGGEERGRRGRKEGKGAEGEDERRVEEVGDQDKMENGSSVALGNRTMEKKVERKTERER